MLMVERLIWIALAGAAGTLARFGLSEWVKQYLGIAFPWGTFAVNMIGSFLFGVVWALAEERNILSADTRLILLTGFMGAFTTFSTFIFDTGSFFTASQWLLGFANIAAQLVVGLIALFLGLGVGRLV
jgi:fluoride exporter